MIRKSILFVIFIGINMTIGAQRTIGDLENNMDPMGRMQGLPDDSTKNKHVEPPVDVRSWTIDDKYGNINPIAVDTIMHLFQNKALGEGYYGHYNTLGNLGSPRINRIFMERKDNEDFLFLTPFDFFVKSTDEFRYYNTKCPYVNAEYNVCGSKTTGYDDLQVFYTNNAGKRFNFGGLFNYLYGNGYYDNQETAFMDGSAWFSYLGDKYDFHLRYSHNYMKMAENGGIADDNYITHPESFSRSFTSNDIPTQLNQSWMRQEHDFIHLNHKYNIGMYRTEGEDSASMKEVFVPVASVFHTLKLNFSKRNYRNYSNPENYHTYQYLPGDTTYDKTKSTYMKNIVGLSLREGFNKWAAAGLNVYLGFENKKYELPDTVAGGKQFVSEYKEHNLMIGGQIIRTQGTLLHFNIDGELVLTGDDSGDFNVGGHGEVNIPIKLFKAAPDTMQVQINAYVKNLTANFYQMHFHGRNAWWDINPDKEFRTRIEGVFTLPQTKTKLTVGVENLKNYIYFQNTGQKFVSGGTVGYSNNVSPMQCGENVQVLSLNLQQNFQWKILHFDNDITIQKSSKKDVIPLPSFSSYHSLYIAGQLVKNVLTAELGGSLTYFSKYNAPDYSPVISQYLVQNQNNLKEIGNYPLISVYAAFDWKQLRAYVQYYHVNQSNGNYFWAPSYPMNPGHIRFGLSWNFYD